MLYLTEKVGFLTVGPGKAVIFFLKQFCFVSYKYLNLYDTISFDMSCFHCAVWCPDAVLYYCVFETCKVKNVLKRLYFERYIVLHFILPNFSAIS